MEKRRKFFLSGYDFNHKNLIKNGYSHLIVTLHPTLYHLTARGQMKKTYDKICYVLHHEAPTYIIVTELTKVGNVHYHIVVNNSVNPVIILDSLKSIRGIGSIYLNPKKTQNETDCNRLYEYIFSDIGTTHSIVNKNRYSSFIDFWQECERENTNEIVNQTQLSTFNLLDFLKNNNNLENNLENNLDLI